MSQGYICLIDITMKLFVFGVTGNQRHNYYFKTSSLSIGKLRQKKKKKKNDKKGACNFFCDRRSE